MGVRVTRVGFPTEREALVRRIDMLKGQQERRREAIDNLVQIMEGQYQRWELEIANLEARLATIPRELGVAQ